MINKNWIIKEHGNEDDVRRLAEQLGVEKPIANLLVQRGIKTFEEAKAFFRPSLENLHDPFMMKDMEKAVGRIENAIKNREKVLIYGDTTMSTARTAVAMFIPFLREPFWHY
jgi:single-stranded-DNA-specific exonuclease